MGGEVGLGCLCVCGAVVFSRRNLRDSSIEGSLAHGLGELGHCPRTPRRWGEEEREGWKEPALEVSLLEHLVRARKKGPCLPSKRPVEVLDIKC